MLIFNLCRYLLGLYMYIDKQMKQKSVLHLNLKTKPVGQSFYWQVKQFSRLTNIYLNLNIV